MNTEPSRRRTLKMLAGASVGVATLTCTPTQKDSAMTTTQPRFRLSSTS
ncbi:MAG: hypothetical protein HC888_15590, partial [Candidatus Competibacteraceae bacterium]|nr:hypothetical protein [Candidatus Competibacteraceae bacterium]